MAVRAKMRCIGINRRADNTSTGSEKTETQEGVLQPVYSDCEENKRWSKWTPYGEVKLGIANPEAVGQFELGKAYWVDFTRVEDAGGAEGPKAQ